MSLVHKTYDCEDRKIGKIPIKNIWLLFLYASDLAQFGQKFNAEVESSPDIPNLIARLLCFAVEIRRHRNLSRSYKAKKAVLTRVRGRIDPLATLSRDLLMQGCVACRYEDHTVDTVRNRLVRAALTALSPIVPNESLATQCRRLANALGEQGVSALMPSRAELSADQMARHDADDRLMVSLARLVFDLRLPMENRGDHVLTEVERDEKLVRRLFEKAVANFLKIELFGDSDWRVLPGKRQDWQIEPMSQTQDIAQILPNMITDIILENSREERRIIIDTKFTEIFTKSRYKERILKSGSVYQMYAYLRSQEHQLDVASINSTGILLHPSIGEDIDEAVTIQGHRLRFMTVDLSLDSAMVLEQFRRLAPNRLA